jgi:hypothetical protein
VQETLQRHPGGHAMRFPEHSLSALQSTLHVPLLQELQIAGHPPLGGAGVAPHTGVLPVSGGSVGAPPAELVAPAAPAAASVDPTTPPSDGPPSEGKLARPPAPIPASTVAPPDPGLLAPPLPPTPTTMLVGFEPPAPTSECATTLLPAPDASATTTSGTHTPRGEAEVSQIHPERQGQGRPAMASAVRSDAQPVVARSIAKAAL